MWHIARAFSAFVIVFALGSTVAHALDRSAESHKAAILTTMTEAMLSTASLMRSHVPGKLEKFSWSAKISDRDWVLTANGILQDKAFKFTISGYLWGNDKEDWLASFSGTGEHGTEPIRINGRTLWHYDKKFADHIRMDFQQVAKFGDHSTWGWVVGSEIVFGGTVGAGAAIATAGAATGGLALGAASWIGAFGAISGSSALLGASAAVKSLLDSDTPVAAPPPPKRPPIPKSGQKLLPEKGMIYTAVSLDGQISGSGPEGILRFYGKTSKGSASGIITDEGS